jgi:hypothetical protein
MASDAASALLLCREQGLITARMSRMDPEMAWVIYRLTLHRPGSAN